MRIVHLLHTFSKLSETFIYDVVKKQHQSGEDCQIIAFQIENIQERPYPNEKLHEIKNSVWDVRRYWNRVKTFLTNNNSETANWNLYRKKIRKKLMQLNPDVIHAHFGPMGILAAPVSEDLNIPLVVSFHGYDAFQLPQKKYWKEELIKLFQKVGAVTVVSDFMKTHLQKIGCPGSKLALIHVGKKLEEYPFKVREGNIKNWLSIGRLSEKKGYMDCLEAFAQISSHYPGIDLKIIGDGPLRPQLEKRIKELALNDQVTLIGRVPHNEVIQYLNEADAFILCSKTSKQGDKEGIPTVLMEAQAMGLPCVTTEHSGIPEVIPEENKNLMAKEGDVNAIAQCIRYLYDCSESKRREISRLGRKKIEEDFNIDFENQKLKNVYKQLISK